MVKNTHGGSGHKKFARKHTGTKNNKLRISEDEGELYAIVTAMLGNGMFYCYCIDGVIRLGHIRGKFTGRGKRDNMVEVGKWLLVGLREWDIEKTTSKKSSDKKEKLQQCDLLEVYAPADKERLKETVSENWYALESNDITKTAAASGEDYTDDILFATDRDIDRAKIIEKINTDTMEKITLKLADSEEETQAEIEVNYDEI